MTKKLHSKKLALIALVCVSFNFKSQNFEVDQIEQLFRPRLRVDSKYIFDAKFKDTSGTFNQKEANLVFTFPIKTKFDTDVKLDLKDLKLKEILKNSIRIKASQTLGLFKLNTRLVNVGFDTLPQKTLLSATGGVSGIKLTKKYRVMFYSLNATVAEQDKTISKLVPRATGLIGQLHLRGLRKNFFYGIAATYSDGLFLPAPFFGGSMPLGKNFIFNYTLPVQLNLQYRDNKKTLLTMGVSADGYRSGISYLTKRLNVNYTSALTYASFKYKFSKSFVGRLEGGYVFYQNLRYTKTEGYQTLFNINTGPYVQVGFNILFGNTIWEKIVDGLINK